MLCCNGTNCTPTRRPRGPPRSSNRPTPVPSGQLEPGAPRRRARAELAASKRALGEAPPSRPPGGPAALCDVVGVRAAAETRAMAYCVAECAGRVRGCSYKRATFVLCAGNVLLALFLLHALLAPLCLDDSWPPLHRGPRVPSPDGLEVASSKAELQRIDDSNRLRRQLLPTLLIERVNEIRLEAQATIERTEALNLERHEAAAKLGERLRELKLGNSQSSESTLQALEEWKKKQLEKRNGITAAAMGDEDIAADFGVFDDDLNLATGVSPQNAELEDDTIPGREMPPECHAEAHTDYAGAAVRWGLTHHVESAADCCQVCLDQAKNATADEKKCNIWVYCPAEGGCHSPDKYTHENHECWLKQADEPVLNFKDHYSEEYRQQHPTVPLVVPWVSGVVQRPG